MALDSTNPAEVNDDWNRDRESFDDEVRRRGMVGYWMIPTRSIGFREPKASYAPRLWTWQSLREIAYAAVDHVPKEEAHRRFVGLQHPDLKLGTAPHYYLGCQLLKAREKAPAHRHTMDAIRFVVQGSGGAHTSNDGEPFPMHKWDLVTTPNWCWHDHVNESDEDTIWLDGAVSPLINHFGAGFSEPYEGDNFHPRTRPVEWSNANAGALRPRGARPAGPRQRGHRYPWAETARVLETLADSPADPFDDIVLTYTDPFTGGPVLPTLGSEIQRLRARFNGRAHRHVHATTYHVLEGEGVSEIGDTTFEWKEGDTFVVPIWTWHRHRNPGARSALLYSIDDSPVVRALGFDREEVEK